MVGFCMDREGQTSVTTSAFLPCLLPILGACFLLSPLHLVFLYFPLQIVPLPLIYFFVDPTDAHITLRSVLIHKTMTSRSYDATASRR